MTRRPGLSLTEVLVALFIMGIGTIAILTLFPLGALNMAQALRDDRTTQAAGQADAFLRWYVQEAKTTTVTARRLTNESWHKALTDPGSTTVSKYLVPTNTHNSATWSGPGYPVVIDPMGHIARGGGAFTGMGRSAWLGDGGFGNGDRANFPNTTPLSRHTFLLVGDTSKVPTTPIDTRPAFTQRICTLLDGMGYDKASGAPDLTSGSIDRDIRYNWLWVLQTSDGTSTQSAATVTVVVFDRRAPMYAPAGSEEVYVPSYAQPRQTRVSFAAGQAPPVQKGGWLMDASVVTADPTGRTFFVPSSSDGIQPFPVGAPPPIPWVRNANFYRVASVTEDPSSPGAIDVELEVALKDDAIPTPTPTNAIVPLPEQYRRFIYLNGAAEVFVRRHLLELN
jgi:type II secretory pathway pseudopilin PulG